jgi:hypothetical protein
VNRQEVGYYPNALFAADGLATGSTAFGFGGEVVNDVFAHPGRHTQTRMGSGGYPHNLDAFGRAAYVRDMYYYESLTKAVSVTKDQLVWTGGLGLPLGADAHGACYGRTILMSLDQDGWESFFYYGGPGTTQDPFCTGSVSVPFSVQK